MKTALKLISIATLALAITPSNNTEASSCNKETKVEIRMSAGAVCWSYQGTATHFEGVFSRGQEVRVEMNGISIDYDKAFSGNSKLTWEHRGPNISGPNNTDISTDPFNETGTLVATLPFDGKYVFSFGPCSMWNGYGITTICATTPAQPRR